MSSQYMADLLEIMARLRNPEGGCPWDLLQTFRSLVPHTLEEAYEVVEVIEQGDWSHLREELGDLLFQVVFYARMAEEQQLFDFRDVVETLAAKLQRRHPHVFGGESLTDEQEVRHRWDAIKRSERIDKGQSVDSALDGVGNAQPAVPRALKLQRRAARVGFDWASPGPVLDKIREEMTEVEEELAGAARPQRLEQELGDLLFACVNLARHLGVDPDRALRGCNRRFESRFRHMEASLAQRGRQVDGCDLSELEALWQVAKREGAKP